MGDVQWKSLRGGSERFDRDVDDEGAVKQLRLSDRKDIVDSCEERWWSVGGELDELAGDGGFSWAAD